MAGDRKPFTILQTPVSEGRGRLSPDGKWLAYSSDERADVKFMFNPFPVPHLENGKYRLPGTPIHGGAGAARSFSTGNFLFR